MRILMNCLLAPLAIVFQLSHLLWLEVGKPLARQLRRWPS